jgi:uncharacterized protein (TIGR02271 family)
MEKTSRPRTYIDEKIGTLIGSGEVTRIEIYDETADIHKEAFGREEVRVNKVVEQETVEAQETIRREEIDINTEGRRVENKTGRLPSDQI